jgi:hypothetical protein
MQLSEDCNWLDQFRCINVAASREVLSGRQDPPGSATGTGAGFRVKHAERCCAMKGRFESPPRQMFALKMKDRRDADSLLAT